MVNMNMIVNSSDLVGYEAETKIETKGAVSKAQALNKLLKIWEARQMQSGKKVAGFGLLAVSLAACNSDDDTPFAQSDIDSAVAAVDLTTDNAAAVSAALTDASGTSHATVDAAITSNDAAVTTAALTHTDGTVYATVDAAKTAGINTSSADAVSAAQVAALTDASGTAHATVDAAITSNDATVTAAATSAAEATLMAGSGFATVSALLTAYNNATATVTPTSATLTTGADTVNGTAANDTITGDLTTWTAGDLIVDASSADSDTITITTTDDITATPTVAGVENINFNLDAVVTSNASVTSDTTVTYGANIAGITGGTITMAVTKAASTVTGIAIDNMQDGVTVASDLTMTVIDAAADADITLNATGTAAQTISAVTGTADNLTIVGSGTALTIADADAEEAISITNAGGSVTVSNLSAATDTLSSLTISAGGAVTITDSNNIGSVSVTTTTGNITIGVTDLDASTTVSATTGNGNVTITDAAVAATSVTVSATGDGDANATGADGDITVTDASLAETITLTATGGINLDAAEAAGTLVLTAGQDSTIANTASDVETITIASNSTGATPVVFTSEDGDGTSNGATDGLVEMDTLNFTGSNSVTFAMPGDDLNLLEAENTGTGAAALVISDTAMTGGTSRFLIDASAGANALDLRSMVVDEIALNYTLNASETFNIASGQNIVVAGDLTADINATAAAVAGNTLTVTFEDDGATGTANDAGGITTTNVGTVTVALNDAENSITTGAIAIGTANTAVITGSADSTVASTTAGTFNASAYTGSMTLSAMNGTTAYTLGSGDDSLTVGGDVNLNVDGGAGSDTIVLTNATDYSNNTVSFSNIETIDVDANTIKLAGSHVTGGSYVIVGGAADTLAVNATVSTGETINLANTASTAVVTINGLAGADTLTGSSTTATTLIGKAGSDVIVGGAGADTVTCLFETGAADSVTLGGGADTLNTPTTTAATITAITVTDFNAGTSATTVDTFSPSLTALAGLTTVTALSDTADSAATAAAAVVDHITSDGMTVSTAELIVLSQTYANDTAALAGMKTAGSDTFTMGGTLDANDAILVAYYTGANTNIAVATTTGGTSSNSFDSVETILVMSGQNATASLSDGDVTYIA